MNLLARHLACAVESLIYGPVYGKLQFMIRSPEPLDPDETWNFLTGKLNPIADWIRWRWPPPFLRPLVVAAKLRQDHVLGIADHYDISNDFYELWLDKKYMFYTAADFPNGDESLEEAQTLKANFLLDLIRPQAGEKILDLGPGWGAMLKHIYQHTGDKENLYGFTISKEQLEYNRTHDGFNVEFRNFITTEYPESFFDKIFSIESFEHVRPNEMRQLAAKLYHALKPGGIVMHQVSLRLPVPIPANAPAVQIFFPGTIATPYIHFIHDFEAAGFRIVHLSLADYRPTLRHWFERLKANRERAIEIAGVRAFNRYLCFFPVAWRFFDDGIGMTVRIALEKPAAQTRSRTKTAGDALSAPMQSPAEELAGVALRST